MKNIVIFASGGGSNAKKIIDHFEDNPKVTISAIVSNKVNAGALNISLQSGIPSLVLNKNVYLNTTSLVDFLKKKETDLIILAGFLWLIPKYLIEAFPSKIVNIHPSLLPKYGGKGMYGHHVHEAVKKAGELESGITIHFVNEHFDEGQHIFQKRTLLQSTMSSKEIAAEVLKLEHEHYPKVIEELLFKNRTNEL